MRVARREFRPRVANANHGTPIKNVVRQALILHPASINETGLVHFAKPILTAKSAFFCHSITFQKLRNARRKSYLASGQTN
jgi:hypothetical protein